MGWFSSSEPQRSAARKPSNGGTNRVFTHPKVKGGFLDDCKGSTRKWNDPKSPRGSSPKGRGK